MTIAAAASSVLAATTASTSLLDSATPVFLNTFASMPHCVLLRSALVTDEYECSETSPGK